MVSIIRFASFFSRDAIRDGTFASADLMIWTVVEPGMYLIAACLVTFRPLLKLFKGKHNTDARRIRNNRSYRISNSDNIGASLYTSDAGDKYSIRLRDISEQAQSYKESRNLAPDTIHKGNIGSNIQGLGNTRSGNELNSQHIMVQQDFIVETSMR